MRLFIGIELDEGVKAAAADAAERLRALLQRVTPSLDGRWIPASNLHITLWFIGEVDDGRASAIVQAVAASPFETRCFDLGLAGCGVFPPRGQPRVFWIGVRQGAEQMTRLYQELSERLTPLGLEPERRAYTAHLTIARVKDVGSREARQARAAVETYAIDCGTGAVTAVTLFRSRLSPRGAAYEALVRVPLS
jgi:RNA 2',3'-cyclic 3'-phosphodiesterase